MDRISWRAVLIGLFLPLLYWFGAVVSISLFGYPGIVCVTPAAWLLALPVGMRTARECGVDADHGTVRSSAVVGGALLGLTQALLLAVMLTFAPSLPGGIAAADANELVNPWLVALIAAVVGVPVTAGLAALAAHGIRRDLNHKDTKFT